MRSEEFEYYGCMKNTQAWMYMKDKKMWGGVQPYNLMIQPDKCFILVAFVRDDFATLKQVINSLIAE